VLKRSDFFFGILSELSAAPVLSFGLEEAADVRAEAIEEAGLEGSRFTLVLPGDRVPVTLTVPGRHHLENALAAAGAACALGLGADVIGPGLSAYRGEEMRTRVLRGPRGLTVIDDSYNAAPDSVQAALRLLAQAPGPRVFVFGDMLELGDESVEDHRLVGQWAAEAGVTRLLAVGDLARIAAQSAEERGVPAAAFASAEEALAALREDLPAGGTLLVKGSRLMRLERVVEGLLADA
jgi:UDP-N-acetylmuramoyl-tripeptide--D-alanyl-D-alanine ligase